MSDELPSDLSAGSGLVDNDDGAGANAPTAAAAPPAPAEPPSAPAPTTAASPAGARRHPSYVFLAVVTIANLVADLVSKGWAKGYFEDLPRGKPRELVLIDGLLSIIYAKNRGGAWGLLQNENDALRRPFFLIVSVVAIVFIVSLYRKLAPGQTALKWGLPLVLGGALGNLVDRIRYGFVVDFLDVYMSWGADVKHWPTFNVADISICVGVGLMAIDMFTSRKSAKAASTTVPEAPPSAAQPAVEGAGVVGPVLAGAARLDAPEAGPLAETLLSAGSPGATESSSAARPGVAAPPEQSPVPEAGAPQPPPAEPVADAPADEPGAGGDDVPR